MNYKTLNKENCQRLQNIINVFTVFFLFYLFSMLLFIIVPLHAYAEEEEGYLTSGSLGENVNWTFNEETKTITISGEGTICYGAYEAWDDLGEKVENLIIEDGITEIKDGAFVDYTSIVTVTIGNDVTRIGLWAFENCTALESVSIGQGVEIIDNYAFLGCINLESIIFPNSLVSIGNDCFEKCTKLKEISFGENLETIGSYAFYGCSSLKEISFPESLNTIESYAFMDCSNIENITMPENIEKIGNYAFQNCSELKKVTFIGDCPSYIGIFTAIDNITICYPTNNTTWKETVSKYKNVKWVSSGGFNYITVIIFAAVCLFIIAIVMIMHKKKRHSH